MVFIFVDIEQETAMQNFDLTQDFTDVSTERGVLASLARNPELYRNFRDALPEGTFYHHGDAWEQVVAAIRTAHNMPTFEGWEPTTNLKADVQRLAELFAKRAVAEAIQKVAENLYESESSAQELLAQMNAILAQAQAKTQRAAIPKVMIRATDILVEVISDAERKERERVASGKPVLGLLTGIDALDAKLGGLHRGLYILAAPPGMGKTSLGLQLSTRAAQELPVIYVTFENPARNLTLKALCAHAGIDTQDVSRGTANLEKLRSTAMEFGLNVAPRLGFLEGVSELSVADVRESALEAMSRHNVTKCLIVVDYLQLWAKTASAYSRLDSPRTRVDLLSAQLRELAMHLDSPVLVIAAQNRQHGDYGDGTGNACLDSLKESGDIEYLCDVAMFLVASRGHTPPPNTRCLQLIVKKNRDGETGLVPLFFRPNCSQFSLGKN
jgi:replicative DNA helicase